jgi:hypothetical protein
MWDIDSSALIPILFSGLAGAVIGGFITGHFMLKAQREGMDRHLRIERAQNVFTPILNGIPEVETVVKAQNPVCLEPLLKHTREYLFRASIDEKKRKVLNFIEDVKAYNNLLERRLEAGKSHIERKLLELSGGGNGKLDGDLVDRIEGVHSKGSKTKVDSLLGGLVERGDCEERFRRSIDWLTNEVKTIVHKPGVLRRLNLKGEEEIKGYCGEYANSILKELVALPEFGAYIERRKRVLGETQKLAEFLEREIERERINEK